MFTTESNENFNFSKTCRLCLNQNKELKSIFDNSNFEIQYSIIISECTDVMIFENDNLPKRICIECVECLNKFHHFRKLVVNSENRLHIFLNKFHNNLDKVVKIENTNNIKVESSAINSNDEPVILTYPVKSEEDKYNLEQNPYPENKVEVVEDKSEICENETFTEPTSAKCNPRVTNKTRALDIQTIFNCKSCPRTFKQKRYLKCHEKLHKTTYENRNTSSDVASNKKPDKCEKSFICELCGKLLTSCGLREHARTHKGEKSYVCDQCGKSFTHSSTLRAHMRIHTGERPYSCDQCGKSFRQMTQFKKHERFHKGEKPYACKYCDKAFSVKFVLTNHELIHSGVKPFNCDECGKSFTQISNLKRHEVTHKSEKPYNCEVCGKSFNYFVCLKTHVKKHQDKKSKSGNSE